jgi:two-component system response regulator
MTELASPDVLLVADSPGDDGTLRALRRANVTLRIAVAPDGVAALDYLFGTGEHALRAAAALPRVVLLDLHPPRVGGLEVLRRLKSDPRTRHAPIVVLATSRERRDVQAAYAAGANSYVERPAEGAELVGTLGDVVRYWTQVNVA